MGHNRSLSKASHDGPTIFVPYIKAFGGVERLILGLSRFMDEAGIPHTVACFEDTIAFGSRADWSVRVLQLKPRRNPASEAIALHRLLKECKSRSRFQSLLFDLKSAFYVGLSGDTDHFIHFTDPPSLLGSEITKHAYSVLRKDGAALTGARVSPFLVLRAELAHRFTRKGVREASAVFVMTERISKELQDLYGVAPVILRPGVPQHSGSSPREKTTHSEIRILSVSRLEAGKNLSWIIHAMGNAPSYGHGAGTVPAWKLEFVGTGNNESGLRELAEKFEITEKIVFHGFVTEGQLEELYSRSHVVAVPAAQGYGLPALEALARGVPVVLNRASGVSEVLGGSNWVALSDDDEQDFAIALHHMLDRIRSGDLANEPLPSFPTEAAWAGAICRSCGWL